ncbi:glycoside hydrolase family 2 protein, partial [candidate division KSB1 bacterium]
VDDELYLLKVNEYSKIIDLNGLWEVRNEDSDIWQEIWIPSSIKSDEKLVFRRYFSVPSDAKDFHAVLFAAGINFDCTIKINDSYIGSHSGGYTGFELEILETALKYDEQNIIEIEVNPVPNGDDKKLGKKHIWGWERYTGIIREIYIALQPKITISDWDIDFEFDNSLENCNTVFTLMIQNYYQSDIGQTTENEALRQENIQEIGYYIEIYNTQTGNLVKDNIANPKYLKVHEAVQDTTIFFFRNVELWSIDNPILYKLQITLIRRNQIIVDRFSTHFGFRDVKFNENGFYLNNNLLKFTGINRIEQHPEYGVSLPWQAQRDDLKLIKDLGINVIRTGPYANHPYFYDLCDKYGILVFEEIPIYQIPPSNIFDDDVIDFASIQMRETIKRDKYHPSIAAWGIGSDLDATDARTADYISAISGIAKEEDNRPVYYSTETLYRDRCLEYVDFKLIDFFSPKIQELDQIIADFSRENRNIPIFIGRIGTDVSPLNVSGGYLDITSLEHQAKYMSDLYYLHENNDAVKGLLFWSFADWKGSIPILSAGTVGDFGLYYRGLVNENREPRRAYQYLNAAIKKNPQTALTMGIPPDDKQEVLLYTGFFIIIFLVIVLKQHRWFGQNIRRSLFYTKIFFGDVLDRRNIHTFQTTILCLGISACFALGIAGISFFYKRDIYFDYIISQIFVPLGLKEIIVYLIWNPVIFIITLTVLLLILWYFIAFIHSTMLAFLGFNKGVAFSFNVLIWSGSNLLFILPFTMALYSALEHSSALMFYLIIFSVFMLWYLTRLLSAMRISYGYHFKKAVVSLMVIFILLTAGLSAFLQQNYQTFTYIVFYLNILNSK